MRKLANRSPVNERLISVAINPDDADRRQASCSVMLGLTFRDSCFGRNANVWALYIKMIDMDYNRDQCPLPGLHVALR